MSTALEAESSTNLTNSTNAVSRVRQNFIACRVKFKWFGTSKTLTSDQTTQAAESFGAEGAAISAAKRLIDTKHESYRSLTSIKSQINQFWRDSSLPYPEAGIRLIRNDAVDDFNSSLIDFKRELKSGVVELNRHFSDLKDAARIRLGSLFNHDDYPSSLSEEFDVNWDFPSVDAPDYLRRLSPEIYRRECERVQTQFSNAVELAEQMFQEQLGELVEHLVERLSTDEGGKQKTFRNSTITNLDEFFSRFHQLNIGSNEELSQLVDQAQSVVRGVEPQRLRDNDTLRQQITTQMSAVQASLDGLMIDRPRRNILRKAR
jgi:hypothetical protein